MIDTVLIVDPDEDTGVLVPTLTDAIAAAQMYWLLVQAARDATIAAEQQANISAAEALQAAAAAIAAAAAAQSGGPGPGPGTPGPPVNVGTATLQTRVKIQRALNNMGLLQTVDDYLRNTYNALSDTSLEWTQAPVFPVGGLVYIMIRAALSWTDAQATALWNAALALQD
jgi:hypothetical protein